MRFPGTDWINTLAARGSPPLVKTSSTCFLCRTKTGPNALNIFRNYRASTTATAETNYYVSKLTHNLTDRQSLNFSYTFRKLQMSRVASHVSPSPSLSGRLEPGLQVLLRPWAARLDLVVVAYQPLQRRLLTL
jgi:hypothetical protein